MLARPSEEWCWQILRGLRWPDGVLCPRCQNPAGRHHRQRYICYYRCRSCCRIFSDLTASPFENTKIPLSAWFLAIDLPASEEQITISRLARMTGTHWETGRMMKNKLHHLREDPLLRSIGLKISRWRHINHPAGEPNVSASSDSGLFAPWGEKVGQGE